MKCRLGGFKLWGGLGLFLAAVLPSLGADLKEAREQFQLGNYAGCLASATNGLAHGEDREVLLLLQGQALLALGRYPEARTALTNALEQERWSVRLCWVAREALQANGETEAADAMVDKIIRMVSQHPSDFRDAASLVVFGRAAVLRGADPKRVLDTVFDSARKADPKEREVYLASGELALEKHDFALAAKRFEAGIKELPDDPDLHCGLARAYASTDAALMMTELESALTRNSNHVGSLLLMVDHAIDAEDFEGAGELLDRVSEVNPWKPQAWAYRSVLAHLQNHPNEEKSARNKALKYWATNPEVDYLIGLKLSQNYRFTEGATHQRQALEFREDYLPAKAQLAQDLLRLGDEAEGWRLVDQVQKADAYDAEAYNLATLHDAMRKFVVVTNGDFLVRMSPHEASLYGSAVLELLGQARSNLCAKYGFEPKRPTIVEVFPEQKDFAVRTFGMPGNPGYLGVCFGGLITANSPAAHAAHPVNWQAVLYHEFCHVVTLQLTRNKMPRWLSEGISVYEERQENPTWGEQMNPRYREMVLGEDFTPVSKLSGAFLSPRSSLHLQFAYYESSLVVEFLVQRFGMEKLKAVLHDLGDGMEINQAIEKNTVSMAEFEGDFAAFARERADKLAPGLDFERPDKNEELASTAGANTNSVAGPRRRRMVMQDDPETFNRWATAHPTNFYSLTEQGRQALADKRFEEAKPPLVKLIELYPDQTGEDCAYAMLAAAHRALKETNSELKVLTSWAQKDDEAADAYRRLMELDATAQDWQAVALNAHRFLAVNPLVTQGYLYLAQASEQLGQDRPAAQAYRALLELDPADPAETHYRLAKVLYRLKDPGARRQVLDALEEAPRYRAALKLLLEINSAGDQTSRNTSKPFEEVSR